VPPFRTFRVVVFLITAIAICSGAFLIYFAAFMLSMIA
jgi:hypothetical protein